MGLNERRRIKELPAPVLPGRVEVDWDSLSDNMEAFTAWAM